MRDDSLLLVTAVPTRCFNGQLYMDDQTCGGLAHWAQNFARVVVATVLVPEELADRSGSANWQPVSEIQGGEKIEILALPWAYRVKDFISHLGAVRRLLRGRMASCRYLCFVTIGVVGDWGCVAALEALKAGRSYAVLLDRPEARFIRSSLPGLPLRRRVKEAVLLFAVKFLQEYLVRRSALGIFQGRECYDAFATICRNPLCVYDVHTKQSDRIALADLDDKCRAIRRGDPLRIVYAGRAVDIKGPLDWVRALHKAVAAGIDLQASWIGDGPALPEMATLAGELGISERLNLPGFIADRAKVMETLREGHIFAFCHKTPESPRCLIEALVAGCPIAGYSSTYAEWLLEGCGGGVLVSTGDWSKLGDAIIALNADRARLSDVVISAAACGQRFDEQAAYDERASAIKNHLREKGATA